VYTWRWGRPKESGLRFEKIRVRPLMAGPIIGREDLLLLGGVKKTDDDGDGGFKRAAFT